MDAVLTVERWWPNLWRPVNIAVAAFAVTASVLMILASVGIAIHAIGASVAIGFTETWTLYASQWWGTIKLLLAMSLVLAIGCGSLEVVNSSRPGAVESLFGLLIVVYILCMVFGGGQAAYVAAQANVARLTATEETPTPAQTLAAQEGALTEISENGAKLIAAFETTEAELRTSRERLQGTLAGLGHHQAAAESSSRSLQELADREALLKIQLAHVQDALGGGVPITLADLERSQWLGQIQGFARSIMATAVCGGFVWLLRRLRPRGTQGR